MKASLLQWGFFLPLLQIFCVMKNTFYFNLHVWKVQGYSVLI